MKATVIFDTTVLIVGGGPAGLAAASELDLHGIDCIVVEPRTTVSHSRPRAKTTNVRTMEHLRRWGVADALRRAAPLPVEWSQRVVFCDSLHGSVTTEFEGVFGLSTSRDERFAEAGQQVPQPVIELVLRTHIRESRSAELRLGDRVIDLDSRDDRVVATVLSASGETYRIVCRYLLGCDGATSVVRSKIGASYVGHSDPRPNFNVVFRTEMFAPSVGNAVQYWITGPEVSGVIGRLNLTDTWWAIFPGIDQKRGERDVTSLIDKFVGRAVEANIVATDPWTARMLISNTFRNRRVFLVGESAHMNPPWGGHGYNTCVGDAVNIGWKIAAVENGWAAAALLDTYETERRVVVERTVSAAEANMSYSGASVANDAASIQRTKYGEFHSFGLVLGYSYAGSPVIQPSNTGRSATPNDSFTPCTEPGSRLPHHWMSDGSSIYDRLGPRLTLLGPISSNETACRRLVDNATTQGITVFLLQAPETYEWKDEFLMIRPDQHIAWRAKDPSAIDLARITGASLDHYADVAHEVDRLLAQTLPIEKT